MKEDKDMTKTHKGNLNTSAVLLPFVSPISKHAYVLLRENIIEDRMIREPITLWGDIIIDGHQRYEIAKELNMPFKTIQKTFNSIEDAQLWIIKNQVGRKNLTTAQRAVLALRAIPVFKKIGKKRQSEGGRLKGKCKGKPFKTTEKAAKLVGVNEPAVKDVKHMYDYIYYRPIIELLNREKLVIAEAKLLIRQHEQGVFSYKNGKLTGMFTESGELTEEAEKQLRKNREEKHLEKVCAEVKAEMGIEEDNGSMVEYATSHAYSGNTKMSLSNHITDSKLIDIVMRRCSKDSMFLEKLYSITGKMIQKKEIVNY